MSQAAMPAMVHARRQSAPATAAEPVTAEVPRPEFFEATEWKYNIDSDSPWWRKLYFRLFFIRMLRFSFKYMKIPAPDTFDEQGRVSWHEKIGIFTDEELAEAACRGRGEFCQVKPFGLNVVLPEESSQYAGHRYPNSANPNRHLEPVFAVAKPVGQLHQEVARVEAMIEKADRLKIKIRHA